jgi:L-rhamnose mutarotase
VARYGSILGIRPEAVAEYKQLHTGVWPEVLAQIRKSGIRNFSIFLREPENLLFSYFEYEGDDFPADMAAMATDPKTRQWWAICGPMQRRLETTREGEWWGGMEEIFHLD